jgi:hypothetical protein
VKFVSHINRGTEVEDVSEQGADGELQEAGEKKIHGLAAYNVV